MSPFDYLRQYHSLKVEDAALGISCEIDVTNYISGMPDEGNTEYGKIGGIIAGKYFGSRLFSISDLIKQSQPFYIKGAPGVSPAEPWTVGSLRRAFGGRASPEEMVDGLRLAVIAGRCKPNGVAAYGKKYLGLDCNAFVGNWLGVSPSTGIFAYVTGYGKSIPSGASPDVLVSKDIVKLPPVAKPEDIQAGTVLCTFTKQDQRGFNWRHIALVNDCKALAGGKYRIELCEWGTKGGLYAHYNSGTVTLTGKKKLDDIPQEMMPGVPTLAYETTAFGSPALRVFLDSTKLDYLENRGYDIGGHYGT